MTKCQWPRANSWLPMTIANSLLPITNYKLPMTKWPTNISISSQFSYEFDSIELHSCYQLTFKTTISILALQSIDFLERVVLIFSPCEPWHFQIRKLSGVVLKNLKDILKANLRVKYQKIFRWEGEELYFILKKISIPQTSRQTVVGG